jgi:hypothetical protein
MADGAIAEITQERDRAVRRLRVLAAEIRVHEETMRRNSAAAPRAADDRLYRRLHQINDGSHDEPREEVPLTGYPSELLPYG